ncbi:MAG TPA: PIN domain-containing protein [Vicinamibacterales bacterium]|nr:PIN domain-containing protein [Vicinamibacterales bacterium]
MSGRAFFDTNILVYVVGQKKERTDTAEALLAGGGIISVQVLNELANVTRKKLRLSREEIDEALAAIRVLCPSPVPLTIDTHDAGRRIAAKYGYSMFDGLIAASALEAACDTLYSEDLQNGQVIEGRVTIRNPFVQ